MITLKLTDDNTSVTYDLLQVPFTQGEDLGKTDIKTINGNVYTDYIYQKRTWEHTWSYMTSAEYEELKGFFDRQFTNKKYPLVTIPALNVSNVPAVMTISNRQIINNCGMVNNVKITLRETSQQ